MKNLMRFTIIGFLTISLLVFWGAQNKDVPLVNPSIKSNLTPIVKPTNSLSPVTQNPQVSVPISGITPVITTPISAPIQASLIDQVPNHNNQSDCWVIYQEGVYNITGFFGQHPGGDPLLAQICGHDMTIAFNAVPHSQRARQILEGYRIQ